MQICGIFIYKIMLSRGDSMVKDIKKLIGKNFGKLYFPIFLMCLDSLGSMVTYFILYLTIIDIFNGTLNMNGVVKYTVVCLVAVILRVLAYRKSYLMSFENSFEITGELRIKLANHFRKLSLGYFNKNSKGYLINTLTNDLTSFEGLLSHTLPFLIKMATMCIFLIIGTFFINYKLALAECFVIFLSIPILIFGEKTAKILEIDKRRINETMISTVLEYIGGIKVFRAYNMQASNFERLKNNMDLVRKNGISTEMKLALPTALYASLVNFIIPMTLLGGGYLFLEGDFKGESLIAFMVMGIALSGILSSFERYYIMLKNLKIASNNLDEVMKYKTFDFDNKEDEICSYSVEFKDVSFSYDDNKEVLHNISFTANEGSVTALIGESGAGKSTIMNLVARFWDVTNGEILIGNKNIKNINPDSLLASVGAVFQENILLSDTIFNNILIGNPNASYDDVIEASKIACCHDFITSLPESYNTKVAEGGTSLSGGEKQRISIARAILKNAPILLLDEFTASLDADNEMKINKAFEHLIKGKTVFVIAHRLHTIKNADQIILLNKGKIEEIGNHAELFEKKGHYYKMITKQIESKKD